MAVAKGATHDLECLGEYFDSGCKYLAASIEAASVRETVSLSTVFQPDLSLSGVQHVEVRDKTRKQLKEKKVILAEELQKPFPDDFDVRELRKEIVFFQDLLEKQWR
jgi:hypothetical protein